jgi:glycosyltransferase involved in cell wall biosynthesis
MLLSIVIPTRNRPGFLSRGLAALFAEIGTAKDVEVIVVDDASGRQARKENIAACVQHGYTYVPLEKRGGAAFTRNCGINSSRGEWIAFLDDDVRVHSGWHDHLRKVLAAVSGDIAGIEGRVVPEGDGLWDREVNNEDGGQYITCHMVYRAAILKKIGGFDEHFRAIIPSCEDHELASRVLRWGALQFERTLTVTHSARRVRLAEYVLRAFIRIYSQLEAEYYFFSKQKDMYHLFRYCQTFFGTYRAILLKHTWTTIRRRTLSKIFRHPVQFFFLHCACVLEQLTAWFLVPYFILKYNRNPLNFFNDNIDMLLTAKFWNVARPLSSRMFRVRYSLRKALFFPLTRTPAYSPLPFLRQYLRANPGSRSRRCFLRIDDVFLDQDDSVLALCEMISKKKVPFLAAVIGSNVVEERYTGLFSSILSAGGEIGLHGFVHRGKFGPYNSEILQLPFPRFAAMLEEVLRCFPEQSRPTVFMPPFNAINRDQILYLEKYFTVICGGPETARFTDRVFGPVALANGSWYVPTFHPFYQKAAEIIRSSALQQFGPHGCNICYAVHMHDEAKNGFRALSDLIDIIGKNLTSWTIFKKGGFADVV